MSWIQIFDVLWLISLLGLLFLIWRSSEQRREQDKKHDATTLGALVAVSQSDAESARKAVQACQDAITLLKEQRKAEKPDVLQ